jgi:N-acetylglucosaminyldiphosphoundecaprenol N-acetyl-beta-D-mannosaminyltransferase
MISYPPDPHSEFSIRPADAPALEDHAEGLNTEPSAQDRPFQWSMEHKASLSLLGLRVHAMTKRDLMSVVTYAIDCGARCIIGNHNVHSLFLYANEPQMRRFYSSADYVQIDGMPLVWLGRCLGLPLKMEHRTTNFDLLPLLAQKSVRRGWRIFYLGSEPGLVEGGARRLRAEYPGLQIATHHGYFDATQDMSDNQRILAILRDYSPDILMVGMGMPRQEVWIQENSKYIGATVIFCCGGLMDYVAGQIPTAPRWFGDIGIEWLFRLISSPRRTWKRYLIEPWIICLRIILEYFRSGHIRIETERGLAYNASGGQSRSEAPYTIRNGIREEAE